MTELPKYDELLFPTLRAIAMLGGSASIDEIQDRLTADLGFAEDQLARVYPRSGAPVLPDRMAWARSFLRLAGLLENPSKGVWVVTEDGRAALDGTAAAVRERVRDAQRAVTRTRKAAAAQAWRAAAMSTTAGPIACSPRSAGWSPPPSSGCASGCCAKAALSAWR